MAGFVFSRAANQALIKCCSTGILSLKCLKKQKLLDHSVICLHIERGFMVNVESASNNGIMAEPLLNTCSAMICGGLGISCSRSSVTRSISKTVCETLLPVRPGR